MNGNGTNGSHREEVEDPDILAAIAASKEDLEEDEEVDPAVLAAIEASKSELEVEEPKQEEPKKEAKGPIFLFGTLGRNDDVDDDNAEDAKDDADNDTDVTAPEIEGEPGDLDPDVDMDPSLPEAEQDGTSSDAAAAPAAKKGKKGDQLNPTLRRAYITKVKPEKRYCSSDDDDDGDWGGKKKKKKAPAGKKTAAAAPAAKKPAVAPTGPATVFKCPHCALTFETIGQLNVHKHSVHSEERPSVLDMGEAVIARLQEKSGAPKDRILKEILADFADAIEDTGKVGNQLGIALVEGIEFGRLRQGTSGKKNWNNYWLQENAKKRKMMMDKWMKDPGSVGDASTSGGEVTVNIIENSGEFMAIKEKLEKYNIQVTTSVKKPDPPKPKLKAKKKGLFDDDDDIEIVSESISKKTKLKIQQKKKMQNMKPKAVIKVNSPQGKMMLKTIVKTGKVPPSLSAKSATSSTPCSSTSGYGDDEDDDDRLTCPACFSAFWYPSQTYEHMSSTHNIENPEKYMKEKKRSRK